MTDPNPFLAPIALPPNLFQAPSPLQLVPPPSAATYNFPPAKPGVTREEWLNMVLERIRPAFEEAGYPLPNVRFTMSLTRRKRAVGVCYPPESSADGTCEILIRIDQDDSLYVIETQIHELCHAAVGVSHGHKGKFVKVFKAIGLTGKPTDGIMSDELRARAVEIVMEIGALPHKRLNYEGPNSGPKKKKTYLLKAECIVCGYQVRVTAKWVAVGAPCCPEHGSMEVDMPEGEDQGGDPFEDEDDQEG